LSPGPPKHEAGVLTTWPWYLVIICTCECSVQMTDISQIVIPNVVLTFIKK
jgi:hypothetical protein